tara:strand:+ start:49 stop:396 length:348 start_codon:yes stop_codon:yes gene_type:complete
MDYGSTVYAGSSGKWSPLILGMGFFGAAFLASQGAQELDRASITRYAPGGGGILNRRQIVIGLNVAAVGLLGGAVLYASGMGRLIGKPQKLTDDQVQLLAQVPVPQLPADQVVAA